MDISNLTSLINALRSETQTGGITPETLGSILQAMASALSTCVTAEEQRSALALTITMDDLDSLCVPSDGGIYAVMKQMGGDSVTIGHLFFFHDDMRHAGHQMLFSNFSNALLTSHDDRLHIWHRWFNLTAQHGTPGTWTDWQEVFSSASQQEGSSGTSRQEIETLEPEAATEEEILQIAQS